jgi:thiol:disulfide interchange protein DsbD
VLGSTLAWTLTQPPYVIYTVFVFIGIGMAFPYVLLSASSRIARMIPRPGKWMDDFKHILGFLLLGFAVYLMKGLSKETALGTIGLCVSAAIAIGVYVRFAPFGSSAPRRLMVALAAVVILAAGGYISFKKLGQDESGGTWQAFSATVLEDAHMTGRHAVANFTASWCMNCQYNKLRVLNSRDVQRLAGEKDVLLLEVDLTNKNPDGESLLHHLGSRSVPFLAVFPGDNPYQPVIMRDILTKGQVIKALEDLPDKEEGEAQMDIKE